jgi:hypothetical protein
VLIESDVDFVYFLRYETGGPEDGVVVENSKAQKLRIDVEQGASGWMD